MSATDAIVELLERVSDAQDVDMARDEGQLGPIESALKVVQSEPELVATALQNQTFVADLLQAYVYEEFLSVCMDEGDLIWTSEE